MKPLNCPKCKGHLKAVFYGKIEIDRCQNCAGMWFDRLEAETLKQISGSEILDLGQPKTVNTQLGRIEDDIKCPRCQIPMIQMLDMDRHSIWYEQCVECEGVWLDAGEFRKFKRNFVSKNPLHLVRRVLKMI